MWLRVFLFLTLFGLGCHASAATAPKLDVNQPLTRLAFGSCAKERLPQPIWQQVLDVQPQMFLFIGDNHYADYWPDETGKLRSAPVTDIARIHEAYQVLAKKPGFSALRNQVPILATWDDHDYGANDMGKEYPLKAQSQDAFLDFFDFSQDDPIRQQQGIYHSRIFGPEGQRTQIIMLDTRYHRDELTRKGAQDKGPGRFRPNADPTLSVLGEQQWQWLEQQLQHPAELRLIVSSIQVVAWEHGWETWGNFPAERQRLYDLIGSTKANGVVFLSGDRHLTEVSVDSGIKGFDVPYPIWDFTASGMTDEIRAVNEVNSYRQGAVYRGSHFGQLEMQWGDNLDSSQLTFTAIDEQGKPIYSKSVKLSELQM